MLLHPCQESRRRLEVVVATPHTYCGIKTPHICRQTSTTTEKPPQHEKNTNTNTQEVVLCSNFLVLYEATCAHGRFIKILTYSRSAAEDWWRLFFHDYQQRLKNNINTENQHALEVMIERLLSKYKHYKTAPKTHKHGKDTTNTEHDVTSKELCGCPSAENDLFPQ